MDNPLISIIVPIYNSERNIERCVNSILNQTYKNIELLLIDDGSNDNSFSICEKIRNKDSRVFLFSKTNGGVSSARNTGLRYSHGNYICFVDSDDYVSKDYVSKLLISYEEGVMPICGINCITRFRTFKEKISKNRIFPLSNFSTIEVLKKHELLNAPVNKLYKKELIKDYFFEDFSIGEDLIFNLLYLDNIDSIKIVKKCLYYYDKTNTSATRSFRIDALEEQAKLWMLSSTICEKKFRDFDLSFFKTIYFNEIDSILITLPYLGKNRIDEGLIARWLNGNEFKKSLLFFNNHDKRYEDCNMMVNWILIQKKKHRYGIKNFVKTILLKVLG